ncbi:hypothetical protein KFL_006240030 [Klebsormidium nitens]|uniref:F-box domain-containing protein n=1 Tax=Klebsormidium nitens TaxID=105231 RepID=A0A1Y1IHF8_KLENI|nr:hypothetical protein KFL_006240030 [Klebsormidium nitens]|eukprot:GAQ90300.1 hypothetical protein KFL_006240030 [Klebsormidium nitens]
MDEPAASGPCDSLPDEVLLLILCRLAVQDPPSLLAATVASRTFDRLAPPQSALWKHVFYKEVQASPPYDSFEARALEKEIEDFGGYKSLFVAHVKVDSHSSSSRSRNLNKHSESPDVEISTFLYLMRTRDGRLFFWGGGTEGESSKRGTLLTTGEKRFPFSAQLHPLVRNAEIRELTHGHHRTKLCLCNKMDYGVSLGSKHENVSYCTLGGEIDLGGTAHAETFPVMDLRDWYFWKEASERRAEKLDPPSLVAATLASRAFDNLAPPQSPLWKDAFCKQLQTSPPCDSPEARALEREIECFGGYKGLVAAVNAGSENLNKVSGSPAKSTFLYLMRKLNSGRLVCWGGGTEGETSKRGNLMQASKDTSFMFRAQVHPLLRAAEMRELMKDESWEPYLGYIFQRSTVESDFERSRGVLVRVWTVPVSVVTFFQATLHWQPLPERDPNFKSHHMCLIYPERHKAELCLCKKMDYGVSLGSKQENVSYCTIIGEIELKDVASAQNFPVMDLRDWYFGRRLGDGDWSDL